MSVYSDIKCAVDESEEMFLKEVARRQAREDEYLYERSFYEHNKEDYEDCEDE